MALVQRGDAEEVHVADGADSLTALCRALWILHSRMPDAVGHALRQRVEYAVPTVDPGRMEASLIAFARELLLADPQGSDSVRALLSTKAAELDFVAKLIAWRLERTANAAPDNDGPWPRVAPVDGVPPEAREEVLGLYLSGRYEQARAYARVVCGAFPLFAEGHEVLGKVALVDGDLHAAIGHFDRAVSSARKFCPRRPPAGAWGVAPVTVPYVSSLEQLARALNRAGQHERALRVSNALRRCGRPRVAEHLAVVALLNLGRTGDAARAAARLSRSERERAPLLGRRSAFLWAIAAAGDDRADRALISGVLAHPRIALALVLQPAPPSHGAEDSADDLWLTRLVARCANPAPIETYVLRVSAIYY